jgi:hypothetical protein
MEKEDQVQGILRSAIFNILKSLARLGLHYGVSAGAAEELTRRAWVEAAVEKIQGDGKKPMSSNICALTGLYRKEVVRLRSLPPVDCIEKEDKYSRAARIITGWLRDERFLTSKRRPAVLRLEGSGSFHQLVKLYSGDMSPRAMLDELLRTGSVQMGRGNTVKLCDRGFIAPKSGTEALQILGDDTSDLIDTIRFNLEADADHRRFQRKVSYLNIPQRHVDSFEDYAASQSQALLEKFDRWLAKRDTEDQRGSVTSGSRLGVGIYLINNKNQPMLETKDKAEKSS